MRSDFVCFYEAGKIASSEDRKQPYDPEVQLRWLNKISPEPFPKSPYIQYVPYVFTLMAPFSALPIQGAFLAWNAFNLLAATFGLALLAASNKQVSRKQIIALVIVILASEPAFMTLRTGQSSLLLTGAFAVFFWAILKNRNLLAGFAAALTTIKPQYLASFAIPIAARWNIQSILATVAGGIVLLVLAGLNLGFDTVINYPIYLMNLEHSGEQSGVLGPAMVSLRGVLTGTLGNKTGMMILEALFLITSVPVFLIWRKVKTESVEYLRWAIAFTVIWQMLFSLHSHDYDCVLLGIAAVLLFPFNSAAVDSSANRKHKLLNNALWLTFPFASWAQLLLLFSLKDPPVFLYWIITLWLALLLGSTWMLRTPTVTPEQSSAGPQSP